MRTPADNVTPSQPLIMRILVRPFVYRHPKAWAGVCFIAGLWVFILGTILLSGGFWWGSLLMAVAALELRIGYRLLSSARWVRPSRDWAR